MFPNNENKPLSKPETSQTPENLDLNVIKGSSLRDNSNRQVRGQHSGRQFPGLPVETEMDRDEAENMDLYEEFKFQLD